MDHVGLEIKSSHIYFQSETSYISCIAWHFALSSKCQSEMISGYIKFYNCRIVGELL
jgi:tryptophanyl-tRNA synthetase